MKKILSIVFLVVPLLFFTYACGEETQAKVPPVVQNVVEKTKTVIEEVETATVEAVKGLEKDVTGAKEETPVAETTEVTTEEEAPAETTEVTTPEETPAETIEVTTPEEAPAETIEVTTPEETPAETTEVTTDEGTPVAMSVNLEEGGKLFSQNCAGCHMGGGNVVNGMKTLKKEALVKYDMYSQEKIVYQITHGKNAMPAFGGRLKPQQIENLAGYVLDQANNGW